MLSVSSDAKTVPAILQAMWIMVPVLGQAPKQPCGNAPDLRPRKAHTPHSTAELLTIRLKASQVMDPGHTTGPNPSQTP